MARSNDLACVKPGEKEEGADCEEIASSTSESMSSCSSAISSSSKSSPQSSHCARMASSSASVVHREEELLDPSLPTFSSSIKTLTVSMGGAGVSFTTDSPREFAPVVRSRFIEAIASLLSHNRRGTGPPHKLSRKQGAGWASLHVAPLAVEAFEHSVALTRFSLGAPAGFFLPGVPGRERRGAPAWRLIGGHVR